MIGAQPLNGITNLAIMRIVGFHFCVHQRQQIAALDVGFGADVRGQSVQNDPCEIVHLVGFLVIHGLSSGGQVAHSSDVLSTYYRFTASPFGRLSREPSTDYGLVAGMPSLRHYSIHECKSAIQITRPPLGTGCPLDYKLSHACLLPLQYSWPR